jgi:hypothetical protein
MAAEHIVAILIQERDRLNRAIEVLSGSTPTGKKRGRPFGSTNNKPVAPGDDANMPDWGKTSIMKGGTVKRKMSAAGRKKIADGAKKRWALIKAGKAPSPFSKEKTKA